MLVVTRRQSPTSKRRSLHAEFGTEREVRMKKLAFICTACATLYAGILFASVLEPKESAAEYPFACTVEDGSLGVDYLRRSLPTQRGMQHIRGVLIFEVGVFPASGKSLHLTENSFELNWKRNKNPPLVPVDYQYVVVLLRNPWWNDGRGLEIGAASVDPRTGRGPHVSVGGPRGPPPVPGQRDPRDTPREVPGAPRKPEGEPHPDELPERIVLLHALPTEPVSQASAGYVYFYYRRKLTKLNDLVLTVRLPEETCEFMVRPERK